MVKRQLDFDTSDSEEEEVEVDLDQFDVPGIQFFIPGEHHDQSEQNLHDHHQSMSS